MRKLLRNSWLLAAAILFLSFNGMAKEFKGVITYKISVEGSGVTDQIRAMMPKTMTITIKGNKARMDMVTGMGKTTSITNGDEKTTITLMDMMGQKFAIMTTSEEVRKEIEDSPEYKVEVTSEVKEIVGYPCKKAVITNEDNDQEIIIYFTPELGSKELNFDNPQFKDIDGVMLEFEVPNDEMTMRFTATSVEKKNVSDSEFEIPSDYQIKTKEEMGAMFGGMGQ